jgi:hypothetical protein
MALAVHRNLQHRSLSTVVSATSTSTFHICNFRTSFRQFLNPTVNRFMLQTLPTINREYFFMSLLCTASFCPQKTHKRTLLFGSVIPMHGRHFDYWNQPLNMRMRICYLNCHDAGLCCYLVIHIEDLWCPLQLFYFHLWLIYGSTLYIRCRMQSVEVTLNI